MSQVHQLQSADGVIATLENGDIIWAVGTTVPADSGAGYAPGCIFQVRSGASAGSELYKNEGSATSCDFNAISASGSVSVFGAITGNDSSFGIAGQAAAQGGAVAIVGGVSSTASNAGGAVSMIGAIGTTTAVGGEALVRGGAGTGAAVGGAALLEGGLGGSSTTVGVGGAATVTAGAGQATAAGGIASIVGGASGAGATGNGGASKLTGGAAASVNGTGGAATIAGGLATGSGTGGAASMTGGASGGASGTGGDVSLASGAATGGTEGSVKIQTVSTGKLGFFAVTPVTRATAYTQTFATADKTHANPTATSVVTTGVTQTTPYGYVGATQGDAVATTINAIIVDLADVKALVNSVIDDLQAYGLLA